MSQRAIVSLFPSQLTILSITLSQVTGSGKFLWEIGRTVEHGLVYRNISSKNDEQEISVQSVQEISVQLTDFPKN